MIIDNLHVVGISIPPLEANTPLVVDADAVLACTIVREFLQAICGWNPEILQRDSPIQHPQFSQGHLLNILGQSIRSLSVEDLFGLPGFEGPYQESQCIT